MTEKAPAMLKETSSYDELYRNFRWDVVLGKYERMFAKVRSAR